MWQFIPPLLQQVLPEDGMLLTNPSSETVILLVSASTQVAVWWYIHLGGTNMLLQSQQTSSLSYTQLKDDLTPAGQQAWLDRGAVFFKTTTLNRCC